jgi:preprotein translocase subunit SecG
MNILIGFLIVVEVIVSLLLILIILVQPSKGSGGLGGAFGGGMGEQLFGARAGNVLTKGTILFATIFVLNTLALAWLYSRLARSGFEAPAPVAASAAQTPSGLPPVEEPAPVQEVPVAPTAEAAPVAEAPAAPAAEAPAAEETP